MDLFNAYLLEKSSKAAAFGNERLYISVRDRIHLSLASVENSSTELALNSALISKYSESGRYVLCKGIVFDLLLSIYDVNTRSFFAFRSMQQEDLKEPIKKFIRQLKRPNLEIRAIGMQNTAKDYTSELSSMLERAYELAKPYARLVEVDLFGSEQRHIAIDTKLGMTFDLLLLNRFYKPGELANQTSAEQFRQAASSVFQKQK
ncbi:MAG: hypothetical protein QW091_01625 [Candidatus Micrarchaeaceae archaeon]